jgi:hypothetical protein
MKLLLNGRERSIHDRCIHLRHERPKRYNGSNPPNPWFEALISGLIRWKICQSAGHKFVKGSIIFRAVGVSAVAANEPGGDRKQKTHRYSGHQHAGNAF